jgi:hypothetical protein
MSGSENGFEFFSDKLKSKVDYSKKSHHEIDVHQAANSAQKRNPNLNQLDPPNPNNQPLKKFKT